MLVILGAIIIDRSDSGDTGPDDSQTDEEIEAAERARGDEDAAALDEDPDAGGGPQGPGPEVEQWDLCELLSQATAESLVGMELSLQDLDANTTCQYKSEDSPSAVTVTLKGDGTTVYHCHTEADNGELEPCPVTGEPVPSLPEGRVSWHQKPPEDFSDPTPSGVWVQWQAADRTWGLWYSDQRFGDERADVIGRKDALIAEAEEIHQAILAGTGRR